MHAAITTAHIAWNATILVMGMHSAITPVLVHKDTTKMEAAVSHVIHYVHHAASIVQIVMNAKILLP